MANKQVWLIDDDNFQNRVNKKTITKVIPDVDFYIYQEPVLALIELKSNELLRPDLLFLDMNMPSMNGEDFLSQLEIFEIDIPVIILSSSLNNEMVLRLKKYPFVIKCMSKPLTTSKLAFLKMCTA